MSCNLDLFHSCTTDLICDSPELNRIDGQCTKNVTDDQVPAKSRFMCSVQLCVPAWPGQTLNREHIIGSCQARHHRVHRTSQPDRTLVRTWLDDADVPDVCRLGMRTRQLSHHRTNLRFVVDVARRVSHAHAGACYGLQPRNNSRHATRNSE